MQIFFSVETPESICNLLFLLRVYWILSVCRPYFLYMGPVGGLIKIGPHVNMFVHDGLKTNYFYRAIACNVRTVFPRPFSPSVCPSNAWIVTKRNNNLCPHSYTTWKTIIHPSFLTRRMVGGVRPILPEILDETVHVGAKMVILNRYSLVAPQP